MKNKLSYKFWLYYGLVLSAAIFIGGFFISRGIKNLVVANFLFLPLVLFFLLAYKKTKSLNVTPAKVSKFFNFLIYYSCLLTTLITLGGFYITRSTAELISNIIFFPITIFCWYKFYTRQKSGKGLAGKTTDAFLKVMSEAAKKRGLDETQN